MIDFGNGQLAAVAKSDKATAELFSEGKTVLYIDTNANQCSIRQPGHDYPLTINDEPYETLAQLNEFDVVEFYNDGQFRIVYSDGPDGATLVATNKCNSNCIMCPCSENYRKRQDTETIEHLCDIVRYMPSDIRHLIITGGEPTLIRDGMFTLLDVIRNHFEDFTHTLLLTNGRTFSNKDFLAGFIERIPEQFTCGIPLYGGTPAVHDFITQSPGSFQQTICGLNGLLYYGCDIELRIVVSKLNLTHMTDLAKFIVSNLHTLPRVNIMATEMCGAAVRNRHLVWANYEDAFTASKQAIQILMNAGIDVALYNFPLCKVEQGYWSLCRKSISDYKIRFYDTCEDCAVKAACGGVFRSTLALTKMELPPISKEVDA